MVGSKLQQLSEQIDFMTKLEQDALDECLVEYGSLMLYLEKTAAAEESEEALTAVEMVRQVLADHQRSILSEYEADLEHLKKQQEIIRAALRITDNIKLAEVERIVLNEAGELDDNEDFKKRVSEANLEMRQEFLRMISEIREVVDEGGVEELAAVCAASSFENACEDDCETSEACQQQREIEPKDSDVEFEGCEHEEGECVEECDGSFDLASSEEIMNILKNFSEPYVMEKKDSEKTDKNGNSSDED